MKKYLYLTILYGVLSPTVSHAQNPYPLHCPNGVETPAPWTGWTEPVSAMTGWDEASAVPLQLGKPVIVALVPSMQATFKQPAGKEPRAYSFGGIFSVSLDRPMVLAVGLSDKAWLDVFSDGQAVPPKGLGYGSKCMSVKYMNYYDLSAGQHIIQLYDAGVEEMEIMAVEQPVVTEKRR